MVLVAIFFPRRDFLEQGLPAGNVAIEALTSRHGKFGFGPIESAAVPGRVVPFEVFDQPLGCSDQLLRGFVGADRKGVRRAETEGFGRVKASRQAKAPACRSEPNRKALRVAGGSCAIVGETPIKRDRHALPWAEQHAAGLQF